MVIGAKTKNLLLDTNLLLLYLIGGKGPKLLESARRLNAYIEEDFYLLVRFIEANGFTRLVSTPHILTEASNLLGIEIDLLRTLGRDAIKEYVQHCNEISHDACMLVHEPEFHRLGLTDIAINLRWLAFAGSRSPQNRGPIKARIEPYGLANKKLSAG